MSHRGSGMVVGAADMVVIERRVMAIPPGRREQSHAVYRPTKQSNFGADEDSNLDGRFLNSRVGIPWLSAYFARRLAACAALCPRSVLGGSSGVLRFCFSFLQPPIAVDGQVVPGLHTARRPAHRE